MADDMKADAPLWEDFLSKASKLHSAFKSMLPVMAAYSDAFQKIADAANNSTGAAKDIGPVLTRICQRHKNASSHLEELINALKMHQIMPLNEDREEWKKSVTKLDKEHCKNVKKVKADIKKRAKQKKSKINQKYAHVDLDLQLEQALKLALCSALVEQRKQFCQFAICMKPVIDKEIAIAKELSNLDELVGHMAVDPCTLPAATNEMVADLLGSTDQWTIAPSNSGSLGSRMSSMCSLGSMYSLSSASAISHTLQAPTGHSSSHYRGGDLIKGGRNISSRDSLAGSTLALSQRCLNGNCIPDSQNPTHSSIHGHAGDSLKGGQNICSQEILTKPIIPRPPRCPSASLISHSQDPIQSTSLGPGKDSIKGSRESLVRPKPPLPQRISSLPSKPAMDSFITEPIYANFQPRFPLNSNSSYSSTSCSDRPLNNASYSCAEENLQSDCQDSIAEDDWPPLPECLLEVMVNGETLDSSKEQDEQPIATSERHWLDQQRQDGHSCSMKSHQPKVSDVQAPQKHSSQCESVEEKQDAVGRTTSRPSSPLDFVNSLKKAKLQLKRKGAEDEDQKRLIENKNVAEDEHQKKLIENRNVAENEKQTRLTEEYDSIRARRSAHSYSDSDYSSDDEPNEE